MQQIHDISKRTLTPIRWLRPTEKIHWLQKTLCCGIGSMDNICLTSGNSWLSLGSESYPNSSSSALNMHSQYIQATKASSEFSISASRTCSYDLRRLLILAMAKYQSTHSRTEKKITEAEHSSERHHLAASSDPCLSKHVQTLVIHVQCARLFDCLD